MNLIEILACVRCKKKLVRAEKGCLFCVFCNRTYSVIEGIINFNDDNDEMVKQYEMFHSFADPYRFEYSPPIVLEGHRRKCDILKDIVARHNLENKIVLDVGSGDSITPEIDHCKGYIVHDISISALRKSRQKVKNCKYIFIAANQDMPLLDNSIDLIFAGEIIEHFKQVDMFLDECQRILKKKGVFVITTPNKDALLFRLTGKKYSELAQHISLQSYNSLKELLTRRFKIINIYGFNQCIYPHLDNIVRWQRIVKWWAKLFYNKPAYATSLIVECVSK